MAKVSRPHGAAVDKLVGMYRLMVLSRSLDQRMVILNRQGRAPFVISGQGQEGVQAGAAYALDQNVDWLAPYYRDMTLVLGFGMTPREIMLGQLAKALDPNSGGRQMPAHWSSRRLRILTGSSPVATQVTHAAGIALAFRLRKERGVVLTTLGDGSTNQGEFHEAMNFMAVHRLPVIVLIENNGYAISVPQHKAMAIQDIAARAAGYGIPGVVVQGSDPLAVYEAVKMARERANAGEGPTLIEAKTHRFLAHSSDDDDRSYRSPDELSSDRADDALDLTRQVLMEQGVWGDKEEQALKAEVQKVVDDATDYADQAALPEPQTLHDHVYGSTG